jgi:hypothetical protein
MKMNVVDITLIQECKRSLNKNDTSNKECLRLRLTLSQIHVSARSGSLV